MYSAAKLSRLTSGWGQSITSGDAELHSSLSTMRARCRELVRDAPLAKRARTIVQNNIIGTGIGMQAQVKSTRGKLIKRINDDIEKTWERWAEADSCHTGGALHFADLERACMAQVFDAGEVLLRKHPSSFGASPVPVALELIEPERLADTWHLPGPADGHMLRMGIEVDRFFRPVAYWLREQHPGDVSFLARSDKLERVPADQIIHLRMVDRWPQTRGEPWLHAAARKLNDIDGYTEAEIIAARGAASYMGFIESPEENPDVAGGTDGGPASEVQMEPGLVRRLADGEKFNPFAPNRPNSGAESFLRFMLREIAAGTGVSYESLSRDYSQSNYSSSRLALLDDRDLYRIVQMWFIRNFRLPFHRFWLQQAVLSRSLQTIRLEEYAQDMAKFEAVRFKPRGWSWIDPAKEVSAYKEAIKAGIETTTNVIAQTGAGRDIEDVLDERQMELELMEEKGLAFDTDPQAAKDDSAAEPPTDQQDDDARKRVVSFKR